MTVILVLAFFLVFIVLDYFLNRRKAMATVPVEAPKAVPAPLGGDYVDGFLTPERVSYHPGHSWLVRERKNVVRVGADEFAAALVGKVEKIELPKLGQWIRQGQRVVSFYRDGQKTEMVSPTEGEVLEVNTEVLNNPGAAPRRIPMAKAGWWRSTCRTKRPPRAIWSPRAWCANGCGKPWSASIPINPLLAGAVAADGGRPAEDLLAALPDADWKAVTGEFFLTA